VADFKGSFEELQETVSRLGCKGKWGDVANGKQFRSEDNSILNWYPATGRLQFQGPQAARDRLRALVEGGLGLQPAAQPAPGAPIGAGIAAVAQKKVFVVHGHDTTAREQLELILHRLDLDPFVLANTGGGGLTIIEALEKEMGGSPHAARFGIVLMTPDDVGYSKSDGPDKAEPRARQNVVLEMGMLISALGRPNVAILKKGHLEIPSDAHGILYLGFNDHVKETVPRLVERLNAAGFKIDAQAVSRAAA